MVTCSRALQKSHDRVSEASYRVHLLVSLRKCGLGVVRMQSNIDSQHDAQFQSQGDTGAGVQEMQRESPEADERTLIISKTVLPVPVPRL